MNRRQFLAGVALAPWWRLPVASAAADPRVRELARELHGSVVGRDAGGFDSARQLFDTRYDAIRPLAVAYCETAEDVERAVRWAARHGITIAPRSGGHSYGGYSTRGGGLVVDVSRLNAIAVTGRIATIGAGARLVDVYERLSEHGLALPAGSCATVGIAGLALGGGHGFLSRKWGTTSDNIVSADVVTADGTLRPATGSVYSDLLWACRGGGGGNFGITTGFRFRVHPVTTVTTFAVNWHWSDARLAIDAWQRFAPYAPDELFSVCVLGAGAGGTPSVAVSGQLIGRQATLTPLLAPLANAGSPTRVVSHERPWIDAALCGPAAGTAMPTATWSRSAASPAPPLPASPTTSTAASPERGWTCS